jgi:hypothetical protein
MPEEAVVTSGASHQLAEILLAEEGRASSAGRELSHGRGWNDAVALAASWKVVPQLSSRVRSLGLELPPAASVVLRKEFVTVYGQSAIRADAAVQAIQALQQRGIPVAIFKGAASLAWLYRDPKLRTIGDADVLVQPQDLENALDCLEHRGYRREGSGSFHEFLHFVEHSPAFAGNRSVTLQGPRDCEIDLHWDLRGSGLAVSGILSRSRGATLLRASIPAADWVDSFLLNIHHAIRENLAIETVIRDLLDVGMWCRRFVETGKLGLAAERAAASGALVSALAVTGLLAGYGHDRAAEQAASALRSRSNLQQQRSAERLIELFHYQVRAGRMCRDIFYLVHPRPLRQILRGLVTGRSGYLRSMRNMEQRRGDEIPLPRRAAQLAQSIPGRRGLKLARELARVKYGAN